MERPYVTAIIPKTMYEPLFYLSLSSISTYTEFVLDLWRSKLSFRFLERALLIGAIELKNGIIIPTIRASNIAKPLGMGELSSPMLLSKSY